MPGLMNPGTSYASRFLLCFPSHLSLMAQTTNLLMKANALKEFYTLFL